MYKKNLYGVIGDPIAHSLSPNIHNAFAQQFDIALDYQKYQVSPQQLAGFINEFFSHQQAKGLNVTLPHKQTIIPHLDRLTEKARLAHSVNTVFIDADNQRVGDTTDGSGLLHDLAKHRYSLNKQTILVIGAGGACQSILPNLLLAGASIQLINRTQAKAEQLVKRFSSLGEISCWQVRSTVSPVIDPTVINGVINTASIFQASLVEPILERINKMAFVYDLNYGARSSTCKDFFKDNGYLNYTEGLGMLIEQAALSFQIWQDKMPNTALITDLEKL